MDAEEQTRHVPVESAALVAAAAASPGTDLRRFFAFQAVNEFTFTAGIWIIFLQSKGFSLAEIGFAESAFHLAPVTLEIPSGTFADIVGRKWALASGALLMAISIALIFVADSLWLLLPAMYLNGAAYACRSGAQQAFLFDSLASGRGTSQFTSFAGKLNAVAYVAIAATTAIGATLAERDYALPFGLAVGGALAAAWMAAGLKEPPRPTAERPSLRGTVGEAWKAVRGNRTLKAVVGFAAALWTVSALVHLYAQAVLTERGLPPSQIGLALSVALFVTAIGAWLAGRLSALRPFRFWLILTTGVIAGSGLLLGGAPVPVAIAGLIIAELFAGAFEPMIANRVNSAISGAQRATILSLEGFLYSVTMIWAFPLFGWTAERSGWLTAYALAAVILIVILLVVVGFERDGREGRNATGVT